jgi:hypothetical protein
MGTMHLNKRLFTLPWPNVYMYFYTTQQNKRFNTLNLIIIFNYAKIGNIFYKLLLLDFSINVILSTTLDFPLLLTGNLVVLT